MSVSQYRKSKTKQLDVEECFLETYAEDDSTIGFSALLVLAVPSIFFIVN
jgi:hypothetical protein